MKAISKKHEIRPYAELEEYTNRVFTEQHYAEIRKRIQLALLSGSNMPIEMELQDIYLSAKELPSKRGRLVTNGSSIFPNLAVNLGFLLPDSFLLTSRGKLLNHTIEPGEIAAFSSISPKNPLVISPKQRVVFLFCFLKADGDLLRLIYPTLKDFAGEITDVSVGDMIGDQLGKHLAIMEKAGVSTQNREQVYRLRRTVDKITHWKGKPYSGKGARDEWATMRLEPFVDLGIFQKPDPFSYSYELTKEGREFINSVPTQANLDEYLESKFMESIAKLLQLNHVTECPDSQVIQTLSQANAILKNNIGYSDITDTCLLACMNSLIERGQLFEIDRAIDVAKRAQKENPQYMHFNVDRWGKLKFISFKRI